MRVEGRLRPNPRRLAGSNLSFERWGRAIAGLSGRTEFAASMLGLAVSRSVGSRRSGRHRRPRRIACAQVPGQWWSTGRSSTDEHVLTAERAHFFDRLARRRVRHALTLSAVAVLTVSVASALHAPAAEAALPLCGGNQTAHQAPRTCTNTKVIDGTAFTVVLDVTAAGVAKVTYTLDEPRVGETPIRVRWHEGINSGPSAAEVSGVIPVGSTGPATLSLTASELWRPDRHDSGLHLQRRQPRPGGWPLHHDRDLCHGSDDNVDQHAPRSGHDHAGDRPVVFDVDPGARDDVDRVHLSGGVLAATVTSQPAGGLPATGGSGMSPAAAGVVALAIGAALVVVTRRGLPFRRSE